MKNKKLGEMLIDAGILQPEELDRALQDQKTSGKRLGQVLIDNHYITEEDLVTTLKNQLGIGFEDLNTTKFDPSVAKLVPKAVAVKNRVVPVRMDHDKLVLAMEDPMNFNATEEVRKITRRRIIPVIAYSTAITRALTALYENEGANLAIQEMQEERNVTLGEIAQQAEANDADLNAPTVKLVNSILERGVGDRASDIHIEPRASQMVVRIRVDGQMREILTIPKDLQNAVISRLKVMSDMNITEHRIPQDGRAVYRSSNGEKVDLRLSSLPTIFGEKIVIRILWRDESRLNREGIGITERDNAKFDRILKNSSGMILIVGPTGSGKTSTLYTMIRELNKPEVNMISLEDPVEFQMDGVTQVAINEKVGLTFASALRACLRQDPDIICVGEIRDGETAEIALRAAMTGHLVLSTIHTEDAVSAIDRLKDLGMEPYLIAGSIRGIISQRLVRTICPNCREEIQPDPYLVDLAGIKHPETMHFYKGAGCPQCNKGYRGRIGVFEILTMDSDIRDAIASGANGTELRKKITAAGDFTSMITNAIGLVNEGRTTLDEVIRTVATID